MKKIVYPITLFHWNKITNKLTVDAKILKEFCKNKYGHSKYLNGIYEPRSCYIKNYETKKSFQFVVWFSHENDVPENVIFMRKVKDPTDDLTVQIIEELNDS